MTEGLNTAVCPLFETVLRGLAPLVLHSTFLWFYFLGLCWLIMPPAWNYGIPSPVIFEWHQVNCLLRSATNHNGDHESPPANQCKGKLLFFMGPAAGLWAQGSMTFYHFMTVALSLWDTLSEDIHA